MNTVKERYKLMCELVHATHTQMDFRNVPAKPISECESLNDLVMRGAEVMHRLACGERSFEEWYVRHNVRAYAKRFMEQEDAKNKQNPVP